MRNIIGYTKRTNFIQLKSLLMCTTKRAIRSAQGKLASSWVRTNKLVSTAKDVKQMKRAFSPLVVAGLLAALLCPAAHADDLLYNNGTFVTPPHTGPVAYNISGFFSVSNSFTVLKAANLTSATAGIFNFTGDSLVAIDWAIGTTPGGSNISSGTSNTNDAFQYTNSIPMDVYLDSFAISGAVTPGTTYYLTLKSPQTYNYLYAYWAINNGPSTAYEYGLVGQGVNGNVKNNLIPGTDSEYFEIYGTNASSPSATPEPGAYAMAASMCVGALAVLRRRRK